MTQISVGIVGLGAQAQNHLNVLSRDHRVRLSGVADILDPLAQSMAKKYGCNSYRTYQELIDSEKLNAVYVVTPNVFHYETLKYALSKKLNVFCEKPMVIKLEHARDLINSVESSFEFTNETTSFSLVSRKPISLSNQASSFGL